MKTIASLILVSVAAIAVGLFCISCSHSLNPQTSFDLSVQNDTATVLEDVKLQFGSHLAWRADPSLAPSQFQTIIWGCEPTPKDTAEVLITQHKGEPQHIIKVNIAALKTLAAGKHEVVFSITALDKARVDVDGPPWRYDLLVIEATKELWADENHKTSNDTPTWAELLKYLGDKFASYHATNGVVISPTGVSYTIGRVGLPASCLIDGRTVYP